MAKVVWTDNAIADLEDIGDHISKDSVRYAEITVERLFESVDILEKHPKCGKKLATFNNDNLRELIRGNYRIVYFIKDSLRIDILTVHNCARELGNTFDFTDWVDPIED
ncbi:MAG: type II toxin-antitoxin system RelE/ParE family toxin [Chitinophagales bacterium]